MKLRTALGQLTRHCGSIKSDQLLLRFKCPCKQFSQMSTSHLDVTAAPAAGQRIFHEGKEYVTVKEGLAYILVPASAASTPQTSPIGENQAQSVFYNPIQQFNRDLSVLVIKAYGEQMLAKKAKHSEIIRQRNAVKKMDKKRKRQQIDLIEDTPRKAGKVEGGKAVETETANEKSEYGSVDQKPGSPEIAGNSEILAQSNSEYNDVDLPSTTMDETPNVDAAKNASELHENESQAESLPHNLSAKPSFRILDALSATGLRALRYAQEIPFTTNITANDLFPEATQSIKLNVKHNRVEEKVTATTSNALAHMYSLIGEHCRDEKGRPRPSLKYDVIDLDPYGTAVPFLDAAVQSVRDDGGLLCVTCTDPGVWASNGYPEKAYSLYGGTPMKGLHSHEGGLRLILNAIATSAARYGMAIEPLLSLSIDYYARVFVRVHKSPADVKFLAGKTIVVYNCDTGCGAWTTQTVARNKLAENKNKKGYFWKHVFGQGPNAKENCKHCGMKTHMAGPMWGGPLHDPKFVQKILDDLPNVDKTTYQTTTRLEGILNVAFEEFLPSELDANSPTLFSKTGRYDPAEIDPAPFFFSPSFLSKIVHCTTPHDNALRGALRGLGYRVTRSHSKPGSIKTDAPWEIIWEMMREWVRQKSPIKEGALRKGTAGYKIMNMNESGTTKGAEINNCNKEKDHDDKSEDRAAAEQRVSIVFDEQLGKEKDVKKLVRYQLNPRENWGPMNRATGKA